MEILLTNTDEGIPSTSLDFPRDGEPVEPSFDFAQDSRHFLLLQGFLSNSIMSPITDMGGT